MDQVTSLERGDIPEQDPGELLARADALRDGRDWGAAAEAYGAYLRLRPEDWGIRVQLGHAVKESGDPAAALAIYREVERRTPENPDIHLQIGHALKLLGRHEEACAAYLRALELDPGNEATKLEVAAQRSLAEPATAPEPAGRRGRGPGARLQLVFDVSDLIAYFRDNRAPTGIQRVQLNVTAQALTEPPEDVSPAVCAFDQASGFWREIPRETFLRLHRLSRTGANTADPVWREAMAEASRAVAEGFDFPFLPGACLVNLGTSWWIKDYFLRVRHVQRHYGVRYIPFVHDCIPLLVPEHCSPGLVREFAHWFASLALHADALIANSDCTRDDARRLLGALVPGLDLPAAVVPLDADMRHELAGERGAAAAAGFDQPGMPGPGEPFALFVGTIESRKNHLLVFNAWLALIRRHGAAAVPRLVCVGKPGWLAEPALQLYANSPTLRARVSIVHGIPDTALAGLYERCLFTVYNSFYEGWGLPVTESLSYGRVPLVPLHSSLGQAGGAGAVFFEHQSQPDLVEKLESLIFDPARRAGLEARIASSVRLRGWGEVTDQILREIRLADGAEPAPPARRLAVGLGAAYDLRLSDQQTPTPAMAVAEAARDGLGWHPLEDWGVWTRPGRARLRLPLGEAGRAAGPLRLYLDCVAPPADFWFGLRATAEGASAAAALPVPVQAPARSRFTCALDVPEGAETLLVEIDNGEGVPLGSRKAPDPRRVGIGLSGFMVCRRDDLLSRLEFLERQQFRIVGPR